MRKLIFPHNALPCVIVAVFLLFLFLTACSEPASADTQVICVEGTKYVVSGNYRATAMQVLVDQDGKPRSCR